jgi:hypothetical protein
MGTFAIALRRIFDDPILLQEDSITTYYSSKDYADDTVAHVQQYLCTIKMEGKVRVTLVEMELSLGWDDAWLPE